MSSRAPCGHVVEPGDRFCGECGQPVKLGPPVPVPVPDSGRAGGKRGTPAPPFARGDRRVEGGISRPGESAERSGTGTGTGGWYTAEITRYRPGCLIFLVDQSGSMKLRLGGGEVRKKHAAAYAINRLLHNTLVRCTKEDGVRPYFDVGVFGYGLDGAVESVFERELLSIAEIAQRVKRVEKQPRQVPGKGGEMVTDHGPLPIWLEALADGKTVMNAAFERALVAVRGWISQHPDSFPPVVINITDGGFTDRSPLRTVTAIQQQSTQDGPALVFNCHLSEKAISPVTFPGDRQVAGFAKRMKQGYRMSSRLPALMLRHAAAKGYAVEPDARGYVFNADFVTLVDFVDIGTRVIQDRME